MGEAFEYFKNQTSTDIIARLNEYRARAQSTLTEIQSKERIYEIWQARQIALFNQMQKFTKESSAVRQQLLSSRQALGLTEAYLNGYRLLNEIGHAFHGAWEYSVTMTSAGNLLTFHMDEEQFIKLGEAHLSGFKLITSKSTILQQMADSQIQAIKWDGSNEDERYNQQAYENYKKIINYARGVVAHAKDNVPIADYNKGQLLEGYFAYGEKHNNMISVLESLAERVDLAKAEHLAGGRYGKLRSDLQKIAQELREQTNSRGFWTGGDTKGQGQIKGEGASMFQYSTIINQLQKFISITNTLNFDKLKDALEAAKPRARQALEKKLKQLIDEVMGQFDATVGSAIGLEAIQALSGDIAGTIDDLL